MESLKAVNNIYPLSSRRSPTWRLFKAAFHVSEVPMCFVENGYILVSNQAMANVLGYTTYEDLKGKKISEVASMPDGSDFWEYLDNEISKHANIDVVFSTIKDGKYLTSVVKDSITGLSDDSYLISVDSYRKKNELTWASFTSEFIFDNTSDAIVVTDRNCKIVAVNSAFTEISGYKEEEVLGKTPAVNKSGVHDSNFYKAMWEEIDRTGSWVGEVWDKRKTGEIYPKNLRITALKTSEENIEGYIGLFTDMTESKRDKSRLESLAFNDQLTGLPNRYFVKRHLEKIIHSKKNENIGVVLLDLDGFKYINDSMGHELGDELLKAVGSRINALIEENCLLARWGGDEFIIVVNDLVEDYKIADVIQNIIREIKKPFSLNGREYIITASAGVSIFPEDGKDVDTLVRNADTAMYQAKEKGRNGYQFYAREMTDCLNHYVELGQSMRSALACEQFFLEYQPQVELKNNSISGVEALVRWEHPELGKISPVDFIPLAEKNGLIIQLGRWVMIKACKQMKEWCDAGINPKKISVNVSALQMDQPGFVPMVRDIIDMTELPASMLEIEITEGIIINKKADIIEKLGKLREIGVSLAIDDFGTGYSSLGYLKCLPVNRLKIDRTFITEVTENSADSAICRAIISLSKGLGLKVIAEGVETKEQMNFLRQEKCDEIQGYYFSPPVPEERVEYLLNEFNSS